MSTESQYYNSRYVLLPLRIQLYELHRLDTVKRSVLGLLILHHILYTLDHQYVYSQSFVLPNYLDQA